MSKGAAKGMVLPFRPLNMAFSHMYYSVDMPSVSLRPSMHLLISLSSSAYSTAARCRGVCCHQLALDMIVHVPLSQTSQHLQQVLSELHRKEVCAE